MSDLKRDLDKLETAYAVALDASSGKKKSKRRSAAAYDFLRWMAGWTIDEDLGDNWLIAHKLGWVEGEKPGEKILFLRQAPRIWHAFYEDKITGSATTPGSALLHGGFTIDATGNAGMKAYQRLLNKAPKLSKKFQGVDVAIQEVRNEMNSSKGLRR